MSVMPASGVVRQVLDDDGSLVARVSRQPGLVMVCPIEIRTLKTAIVLQSVLERHLYGSGCSALLIDATGMTIASRDVNECMWDWADSCPLVQKIAVVNESAVMSVAVEMRAVANGQQQLRGFQDVHEAASWLRDATSNRRSVPPAARRGT